MITLDFGRWGNSQHTMTTFVWAGSAPGLPPPPVIQVVSSSVDQWYAIDYRSRRKRELTTEEWRVLQQMFTIWRRSRKRTLRELGINIRLERRFSEAITPRFTPRDLYGNRVSAR